MGNNNERTVEIVLKEAVFKGFEDKRNVVVMSFIVSKDAKNINVLWSVATEGTTINPIVFFGNFEDAQSEFHRRCGALTLGNFTMAKHNCYGEIRGSYNSKVARKDGFVVRPAPLPEVIEPSTPSASTVITKSPTPAPPPEPKRKLGDTLILEDTSQP
tara:strand:- start:9447 stop:9920 length:474 start_codon:yes stop_codon:yes gene_type:complete